MRQPAATRRPSPLDMHLSQNSMGVEKQDHSIPKSPGAQRGAHNTSTSTGVREIHCLPQIPATEEAAAHTSCSPVLPEALTASSLLPALHGDTQQGAWFLSPPQPR